MHEKIALWLGALSKNWQAGDTMTQSRMCIRAEVMAWPRQRRVIVREIFSASILQWNWTASRICMWIILLSFILCKFKWMRKPFRESDDSSVGLLSPAAHKGGGLRATKGCVWPNFLWGFGNGKIYLVTVAQGCLTAVAPVGRSERGKMIWEPNSHSNEINKIFIRLVQNI